MRESTKWIRVSTDLTQRIEVFQMACSLGINEAETVYALHRLAGWFQVHGSYGKMDVSNTLIDRYVNIEGMADELESIGWLKQHAHTRSLAVFCAPVKVRKSISDAVRREVLSAGKCENCPSTENLVVDHVIPVKHGGSCEIENLQCLCQGCNIRKGSKTPEEWMAIKHDNLSEAK